MGRRASCISNLAKTNNLTLPANSGGQANATADSRAGSRAGSRGDPLSGSLQDGGEGRGPEGERPYPNEN